MSPEASRASTSTSVGDLDGLSDYAADLASNRRPGRPFLLLGQMTTADPSRSPASMEVVWAYTHLPRRIAGDPEVVRRQVAAVEELVERHALTRPAGDRRRDRTGRGRRRRPSG